MFCTEKSQGDSWNYEIVNKGDRFVGLRVYHVLTVNYFIVFLFYFFFFFFFSQLRPWSTNLQFRPGSLVFCLLAVHVSYVWLSKCLFIPLSRQLTIILPEKKHRGQTSSQHKKKRKENRESSLVQIGLPSKVKWQDINLSRFESS